jgi:hypothetical protein
MRIRTLCISIALCCASLTTLAAEQDGEQPTVRIEFSAYSLSNHLGKIAYLANDGVQHLEITNYRRSELQSYEGPPVLTFFHGELDENGQPVDILTQVPLNTQLKRPLLLFAESTSGTHVLQIEDDVNLAPAGSLRFMNLSDMRQQLFVGIGESAEIRKKIEPLGIVNYRIEDDDVGNLRIQIARANDGAPEMLKDMRIFPSKLKRNLYFIFQPDLNKPRLKIKLLSEKPHPAQVESSSE